MSTLEENLFAGVIVSSCAMGINQKTAHIYGLTWKNILKLLPNISMECVLTIATPLLFMWLRYRKMHLYIVIYDIRKIYLYWMEMITLTSILVNFTVIVQGKLWLLDLHCRQLFNLRHHSDPAIIVKCHFS